MRENNYNYDPVQEPFVANARYQLQINPSYKPVVGENLKTYLVRLAAHINYMENVSIHAHILGRKTWYCHTRGGDCFCCIQIQFNNDLMGLLQQIPNAEKFQFTLTKNGNIVLSPMPGVSKI